MYLFIYFTPQESMSNYQAFPNIIAELLKVNLLIPKIY